MFSQITNYDIPWHLKPGHAALCSSIMSSSFKRGYDWSTLHHPRVIFH